MDGSRVSRVSVVASALLAASVMVVLAAPAASAREDDCPMYEFCLYDGHGSSGQLLAYTSENKSSISARINDRASSVVNKTTCAVELYMHANYEELITIIPPGYFARGLFYAQAVELDGSFDNVVSSFRFVYCTANPHN